MIRSVPSPSLTLQLLAVSFNPIYILRVITQRPPVIFWVGCAMIFIKPTTVSILCSLSHLCQQFDTFCSPRPRVSRLPQSHPPFTPFGPLQGIPQSPVTGLFPFFAFHSYSKTSALISVWVTLNLHFQFERYY